jgi:hypothetical protein
VLFRSLCTFNYHVGRIYIYFGGPNPDTNPDLRIDGIHGYDGMGSMLASGDYNGDGFGDLIAHAGDPYYGERICIFLGGNPPDTTLDWVYNQAPLNTYINQIYAGFDPNGDGFDDFYWNHSAHDSSLVFFLGGDTISHQPAFISNSEYRFCDFDLSGDGIDDFTKYIYGDGSYLCLGGAPFDTIPDYPQGWRNFYAFILHRASHLDMALTDDNNNSRLVMYNIGIPPDTTPVAYFPYGFARLIAPLDVGDINGDGNGELALGTTSDSTFNCVYVYTIVNIDGIDEGNGNRLPDDYSLSAYPNPFNSSTTISITGIDKAEIGIYDITGRLIAKLAAENGKSVWEASGYSSGVYFARIIGSGGRSKSIRLVLLK